MKPFILVVDDDTNIASLVTEHLTREGYRVTYCMDAKQAVIQLEGMKVGLLITDIMMPIYGTGVDAYKRIRENPRFKDLPVIFLTGLTPAEAQRVVPKGDPKVRLLHKPTSTAKLVGLIRELTGETLQDAGTEQKPKTA